MVNINFGGKTVLKHQPDVVAKVKVPWNKGKSSTYTLTKTQGAKHWNWKGGKTTKACSACQKEFRVFPSQNHQNCCSKKCAGRIQSQTQSGKQNPNWGGGVSTGYYLRLMGDKRKNPCELCGASNKTLVHHKDKNRTNNRLDNLQVICYKCHTEVVHPSPRRSRLGWKHPPEDLIKIGRKSREWWDAHPDEKQRYRERLENAPRDDAGRLLPW